MNKKQWNVFGLVSIMLSVYFFIWGVMDSISILKYSQATFSNVLWAGDIQQMISIILFGLGVVFYRCGYLEKKKLK